MSSHHPIAVTGATGALGGLVARRLADRGIAQRLVVRDPARAPRLAGTEMARASYGDGDAMRQALSGIHTLLLVSASESADRVHQHLTAVDAASAAGVRRIVYTSFIGAAPDATFTLARHHFLTEQRIRASGMRFTFLRDSLYLDLLPFFVGEDRMLRGPAGQGRVGAVARCDIADVAVAVLVGRGTAVGGGNPGAGNGNKGDNADGDNGDGDTDATSHDGRTYDLTGPAALTLHEVAAELSRATRTMIGYHPETLAEAYASRIRYGAPDWEVDGWVTSYAAVATGELDLLTDHVEAISGHPPRSLADVLAKR